MKNLFENKWVALLLILVAMLVVSLGDLFLLRKCDFSFGFVSSLFYAIVLTIAWFKSKRNKE